MLSNFFTKPIPPNELKIDIHNPQGFYDLANGLNTLLQPIDLSARSLVVLCIGTDRSTGDALGPLTGSKLKTLSIYPHIFGTLDEPVHATNLLKTTDYISAQFQRPFIIAVDACLGKNENVGYITIGQGSLQPGAAVNKSLPPVGDIFITGIVNIGGFMEHMVLQSTRLHLVVKMADIIAHGLSLCLYNVKKQHLSN